MQIIRTSEALRKFIIQHSGYKKTIGFVPTMGALHDGHRTLMLRSVAENDFTVVSVFVNPTQFNNADDLTKYPRQEREDFDLIQSTGADLVFAPSVEEMYPPKENRSETFHPVLFDVFEGAFRPGHFAGVVMIVRKFFELIHPTRAYFGEKDFQQLAVIRAMVQTENLSVEIVACHTVREDSGLALSSRNQRLTPEAKAVAPLLFKTINDVRNRIYAANLTQADLIEVESSLRTEGFDPEYFAIINPHNFEVIKPTEAKPGDRIIAAAWLGGVRLIDNLAV